MMRLENISLGYKGKMLIDGAELKIRRGELTALIGRNGTGKSTLLRAIAGISSPSSGNILLNGLNMRDINPERLARTVALVTPERVRVADLRCEDVVALGRAPYTNWIGRMQSEDRAIVEECLAAVDMQEYAHRTMDSLSDGESQRIMIARALAQQTPILLLDEPTSFLDLPNRYKLVGLLSRLSHEQNKAILFSTHELDIATRLSDSIALIDPPTLRHLAPNQIEEHIERLFGISI